MSKQFGISSVLAAVASMLVVGMVAVGTAAPAQAASEEDLAAPRGAFVSTMAAPADRGNVITLTQGNRPAAIVVASEEDAAVPQGAFKSSMTAPDIEGEKSVASNSAPQKVAAKPGNVSEVSLSEIVAASLE
jgi:hypothetical protein